MSLRWVWHLYNLPCVSVLFWLISIARYVFKSPSICFWGTKYDVGLLWACCLRAFYIVTPGPAVIRSTVGRFLSRVSYLPSYVFLWRRRSFTSRKLYAWLEKFLCFLALWSSLCFWSSMYWCFSFDRSSTTGFECNSLHTSLLRWPEMCWLLRVHGVVYAIVRFSSGKTMVSMLHVDLISCWYFYNTLYVWSC